MHKYKEEKVYMWFNPFIEQALYKLYSSGDDVFLGIYLDDEYDDYDYLLFPIEPEHLVEYENGQVSIQSLVRNSKVLLLYDEYTERRQEVRLCELDWATHWIREDYYLEKKDR